MKKGQRIYSKALELANTLCHIPLLPPVPLFLQSHRYLFWLSIIISVSFLVRYYIVIVSSLSVNNDNRSFDGFNMKSENASFRSSNVSLIIVTLYTPSKERDELRTVTWPNKMAYAMKHGYKIYDGYERYPLVKKYNSKTNGMYLKYLAILGALEEEAPMKADWILWMDADSIFLNHSKTVDEHLDTNYDLVLTADGKPSRLTKVINAGVFLIKNTPFSHSLFEYLASHAINHPKECPLDSNNNPVNISHPLGIMNGWLDFCHGGDIWQKDQGLLMLTLRVSPKELVWKYPWREFEGFKSLGCHAKYVGLRDFNSYAVGGWYLPGDWIIHLPGISHARRMLIFNEFLRLTNFETGLLDPEQSKNGILKPNFYDSQYAKPKPEDLTENWEGKNGWNYTDPPCQSW